MYVYIFVYLKEIVSTTLKLCWICAKIFYLNLRWERFLTPVWKKFTLLNWKQFGSFINRTHALRFDKVCINFITITRRWWWTCAQPLMKRQLTAHCLVGWLFSAAADELVWEKKRRKGQTDDVLHDKSQQFYCSAYIQHYNESNVAKLKQKSCVRNNSIRTIGGSKLKRSAAWWSKGGR